LLRNHPILKLDNPVNEPAVGHIPRGQIQTCQRRATLCQKLNKTLTRDNDTYAAQITLIVRVPLGVQ